MKFIWSAHAGKKGFYNTLFAAKVLDKNIVKVVVSNVNKDKSLDEVKNTSTFYMEMPVNNGYAINYSYLPNSKVGGFVFFGADPEGKVISKQ